MTANAVPESSCWPAGSQAGYWKMPESLVFLVVVSSPAHPVSPGPAVMSGSPAEGNGFGLFLVLHVDMVQDLVP